MIWEEALAEQFSIISSHLATEGGCVVVVASDAPRPAEHSWEARLPSRRAAIRGPGEAASSFRIAQLVRRPWIEVRPVSLHVRTERDFDENLTDHARVLVGSLIFVLRALTPRLLVMRR